MTFRAAVMIRSACTAALAVAVGMTNSSPVAAAETDVAPERNAIGAGPDAGCGPDARRVRQLVIDEPGVYENYLVDGAWGGSTLVKIRADNVTLRNCEIRNGTGNAVTVYARDVVIESCRIHHVLAGTFADQQDAHGITGQPHNLVIRNCEIGIVSGDAVQFDPGRASWGNVVIENCTLWTAPLTEDAAGFRQGERPGENAVDTKQRAANPRSDLVIRNSLFYGWNQPGQIANLAALNLKNHVEVRVENCVFRDNEICFRVRGDTGEYGGALVSIDNCAVYDSSVAVRAEDRIENLKVRRLGIGPNVERPFVAAGGGTGPGYESVDEYAAPKLEKVLRQGLTPPAE